MSHNASERLKHALTALENLFNSVHPQDIPELAGIIVRKALGWKMKSQKSPYPPSKRAA